MSWSSARFVLMLIKFCFLSNSLVWIARRIVRQLNCWPLQMMIKILLLFTWKVFLNPRHFLLSLKTILTTYFYFYFKNPCTQVLTPSTSYITVQCKILGSNSASCHLLRVDSGRVPTTNHVRTTKTQKNLMSSYHSQMLSHTAVLEKMAIKWLSIVLTIKWWAIYELSRQWLTFWVLCLCRRWQRAVRQDSNQQQTPAVCNIATTTQTSHSALDSASVSTYSINTTKTHLWVKTRHLSHKQLNPSKGSSCGEAPGSPLTE